MHCINTSHPEYLELLAKTNFSSGVLQAKIGAWMTKNTSERFPSVEELQTPANTIKATLKIISALEKIQRGVFTKDKLQGWLNDLQKQGVSAQQLELFKEVAKPGMTKDEITAAIYATYSYTVEINTAETVDNMMGNRFENFSYDGEVWINLTAGRNATKEELEYINKNQKRKQSPTNYYSNLTVPGGTNYTEQEIATPGITPSIKGHAEFATDQGIGWFRSDDKTLDEFKGNFIKNESELPDEFVFAGDRYYKEFGEWQTEYKTIEDIQTVIWRYNMSQGNKVIQNKPDAKTRRILEVQSDLFQKGRDKQDLSVSNLRKNLTQKEQEEFGNLEVLDADDFGGRTEEQEKRFQELLNKASDKSSNQFLQLLNKDNNWVTFFIKSIIQDSAKKGYEKVLFPSGNTASKVEGHTTLEEFKKQKQDRIKELENRLEELNSDEFFDKTYFIYEKGIYKKKSSYDNPLDSGRAFIKDVNSKEEAKEIAYALVKKDSKNEINQLKQELERVEGPEGFAALKPIYNFYENTVANVLKKQGYSPKQVTDEYGNTWNEVELTKKNTDTIYYQVGKLNYYQTQAKKIFFDQVYNKELSDYDIANINQQLRYYSRLAGDQDWVLRLSQKGNYYVAGYKNFAVTSPDYYSPNSKTFRQLYSSSNEGAIQDLNDKLEAWAKTNGISIESLNSLKERFKDRYPDGILGIADIANLVIGLADNIKIDTLPEEVGHFALEILQNTEAVKRALDLVVNTEEYAEVKENYKGIYKEEIDFRKEALGKILAKEIVNQYKTSKEQEGFLGAFKAYIKTAAKNFLNWVNKTFSKGSESRDEIADTIIPIAKSILANKNISTEEVLEEIRETDKMFAQLDEESEEEPVSNNIVEKKKKFLVNVQEKLIARKDKLARSVKNTATIDSLEREIKQLEHDVARGELDLAISNLFALASKEIGTIEEALNKHRNNISNINPNTLVTSEDFLDMYQNIFQDFLKDMYDANVPFEELEDFENIIDNVRGLMNRVRGKLEYMQRRVSIDFLNKGNTDHNGNIIDPDFNAEEVYDRTDKDMSYYRLQVGNYKNADSNLIRIAHKIVFDSIAIVKRFAAQKANTILSAQELFLKAGFNTLDLVEKDSNGKPTNYLIREYHWGRYYEAMAKTRQDIADALGFESFSDIAKEFLSKEDAATYKAHWKDFFKNHSKEKVEMVTLDTGEVVRVTTKVPNDSYINHEYNKQMSNPAFANYYNTLVESKKEALSKLPVQYRTDRFVYSVPPILNSTLDELTNTEKGFLKRISALASRALLIDEDDTMFGQLNVLNNKMVPIFFTGKLKDTTDLSYDFGKTFTLFSEMAENFKQMNKIAGELGVIQKTLARREYEKKNIIKKGIESNEYKALETLLDTHVFGIERSQSSVEIPSNKLTEAVGIAGKKFSWTKASQRFSTFIRDNNLVLNITTSLAGYLKGTGDSIIEDITGVYTTNDSKMWARQEFLVNMPQVLSEVGKAKQNNKMHLLLQENEIVDLDKVIKDSSRSRVVRKLATKDLLYTNYATGDYGLKGRITLAIYDNYRLYDGKFLNREEYLKYRANKEGKTLNSSLESEYKADWKALREKSLYNAFEVVKGELKVKSEFENIVNDSLLARVKGRINHMTNYIDGTLSASDKGALSRHWSGDYLLMHRGWFIGLVDTRFQRDKFNYQTGQREVGSYRATGDLIFNKFFATLIKEKNLKAAFASWDTLTPGRKAGVRRTVLDGMYLALVSFIAALANIAADDADDEDFTTQYMAYQLNRLLLEQGAAWSPAELIQMIDEPVVGARMIKDIADIFEAFNTDEVYESGMYEGKSHATKWWMKKLPTRNLYELQFPELKNRFIKQLVDSKTYELLKPDEANTIGKTGVFRSWLVPRDLASDGTDADETQNMNNIVDSWASDEDEENSFN